MGKGVTPMSFVKLIDVDSGARWEMQRVGFHPILKLALVEEIFDVKVGVLIWSLQPWQP